MQVAGGVVVERSSAAGRTLLDLALDPGAAAQLSWTVRESAEVAAPREVRFLSDLKTLVTAAESDVRLTTLVDLTIVQGEPTQVEVALPAGFEVVAASGATLEDSAPRTVHLQASLRSLEAPFTPCSVAMGETTLPADQWQYDASTGVLTVSYPREAGPLRVQGC